MILKKLPNMIGRDEFLWSMSGIERPVKIFGFTIPFIKIEIDSFVYNEEIFEANGAKKIKNGLTQNEYNQAISSGLAILCQSNADYCCDIELFKEVDEYKLLTYAIEGTNEYRLYTIPIEKLSF